MSWHNHLYVAKFDKCAVAESESEAAQLFSVRLGHQERLGEVMFSVRNILTKEELKDKSMLKHIMRKCKMVNYVDKETSSGTQISSRRRSLRTAPARLHRTCTMERHNTNLEELTKNNTADLFTKHRNGLRTQSLTRELGLRILDGTNGDD